MIDKKQLYPSSNDYVLIWDVIMYLIDSSCGWEQMTITQQSESFLPVDRMPTSPPFYYPSYG